MAKKIPVGLQLYTLRDETQKDFIGTLKKVAEMGYQGVEFAGYGDIPAQEMKKVLDELGLKAISSHLSYNQLKEDLQGQINYSLTIGAEYIVCPWLDKELLKDAAAFNEIMETFRQVGEACKSSGLQFAYHNHDFEFEKVDGEYILDRMFNSLDADVFKAELDLYWVTKAGLNAKQYLLSYSGRSPLIHVKDMADDEEKFFAEVGYGTIDYKAIFDIAEEAGVQYYIVEQDRCKRPPLESVNMSINYLKSIGIG